MKIFDAPSAYLQTPDDWTDVSTYILAAPRVMGFNPTVIVTIMRQVIVRELQTHIDQQVYEMQKLSGFRLLQRQPVVMTKKGKWARSCFRKQQPQGPDLPEAGLLHGGPNHLGLTATRPLPRTS